MTSPPRRMPRYAVIDGFLPANLHRRLLDLALSSQAEFEPTLVRVASGGVQQVEVRRSWSAVDGLGPLAEEFTTAVEARFDEIRDAVGVPPFPVEKRELELVAHGDGCFYRPHLDTLTGADGAGLAGVRAVTLVYYLHRQPKGFTGGELALYPFSPDEPVLLAPDDNRLLAFPSFARHEVHTIACPSQAWADSRFAVNCWYRRPREA